MSALLVSFDFLVYSATVYGCPDQRVKVAGNQLEDCWFQSVLSIFEKDTHPQLLLTPLLPFLMSLFSEGLMRDDLQYPNANKRTSSHCTRRAFTLTIALVFLASKSG